MLQAFRPLLTLLLLLTLASGVSTAELRGKVTDVRGQYVKFDLSSGDGLQKGQTGSLLRGESGKTPLAEVEVTAVLDSYAVAKVASGEPQVGDIVVLDAAASGNDTRKEPQADDDAVETAIDKLVDLELESGTKLEGIKLLRVARDDDTGEVKSLRMEDPRTNRRATIVADKIKELTLAGQPLSLESNKPESGSKPKRRKTRNQRLAELRSQKEAEERKKWLARLEVRGIKPWPKLTDEEHEAAIEEYKKIAAEVAKVYPGMALQETEHFLFLTNIPAQQVVPYIANLDNMYEWMCKTYNIKKNTRVWKGKALVVAFLAQEQFMDFERRFMGTPVPAGVYGICHQKQNGDVLIACYRGNRQADFAQMLVHETSHGFIHRYKTPVHFPNWVNEGMADYIGLAMVPACKSIKRAELEAIQIMRQTGSMGGDFFTKSHLDAWQYGVASNLCEFMIRSDPKAYVNFIEGMKEGLTWQESLEEAYNATPEQLVASYGRAIGIPNLRP